MSAIKTKDDWLAAEYHENSGVQFEAAKHVLRLLNLDNAARILDIGSGDGKITAEIANELTFGKVIGADLSEEMVGFAQNKFVPSIRNNLQFIVNDANNIDFNEEFDVVFSSFALQWVPNVEVFFHKAFKSLSENGRIACTIPLSISDAMEDALALLLVREEWSKYFNDLKLNYYLRDENYYERVLKSRGFKIDHFEVVFQKWVFEDRREFEQYTLMWLPHLSYLPEELKEVFFNQLMDMYVELVPLESNGNIRFDFERVDFIAAKLDGA